MSNYSFASIFFFLLLLNKVSGQTMPPIQTDRPDQTECSYIVPVHYLQAENGFLVEKQKDQSRYYTYPSTLWKYGISDRLEFRLITELAGEKVNGSHTTGLNPVTIGFKANLCKEKGIIPMTSFIGHLTTPDWGSKKFSSTYYAPSFRFTMQHTLPGKWSLAYNLGAAWDGETPEPTFIYTLTTAYAWNEKLGSYIELYGFAPQLSKADHRCDGGFTYLVSNHVMIDISGGFGLTDNSIENYLSLGFSYRIKTVR